MKKQARDRMIRDTFIAGQGQCALRRQLDGFAQDTPIGEIVWESHSDSNRVSTVNYDAEVRNQPSESRTWERRKVVVDIGNRKDDSRLGVLADWLYQSKSEETRKRDRPPTGGPVGFSCGNDGHKVNRCPPVSAVSPHLPGTGLSSCDNEQYRVKNKNQKLIEGPGNEQRSEREGQPLGPPGIKAPLTQVGVSTEISNGNPIGMYIGKIVSGATGRPIVGNFRHWRRRGRPEIPRDQPVPVPPKWTGDRWANRRRSSEIWTGGCGRLKTFGRLLEGTLMLGRGESRNP